MSPSARLSGRIAGVRDHLRRRAALAVTPWVVTGVVWFLILAWIAAGSDGWRQGSNVPALFDVLMGLWAALGFLVVWTGVRRWFGEVPLARAIERAAGLNPGTVRGSLELSRDIPVGCPLRSRRVRSRGPPTIWRGVSPRTSRGSSATPSLFGHAGA